MGNFGWWGTYEEREGFLEFRHLLLSETVGLAYGVSKVRRIAIDISRRLGWHMGGAGVSRRGR